MRAISKPKSTLRIRPWLVAHLCGMFASVGVHAAPAADLRLETALGAVRPGARGESPRAARLDPLALRLSPSLGRVAARSADLPTPAPLPPAPKPAAAPRSPGPLEEMLLEVDVNQQQMNRSILVLRRADGMFFVSAADLDSFRLLRPAGEPYVHQGEAYYPLDAVPGARFEFDEATQRLRIAALPEAFADSRQSVPSDAGMLPPVLPSPGAFSTTA